MRACGFESHRRHENRESAYLVGFPIFSFIYGLFEPENGEQREYNQEYQLYRLQELQGIAAGVCKGIGKFYLCKIGDTYGYVHKSHMTK